MDKDPIEEINKQHDKLMEEKNQTNGYISGENSKIPSLQQDEEELKRKEEKLRLLIQQEVDQSIKTLNESLPNYIQQAVIQTIQQLQQNQQPQGMINPPQDPNQSMPHGNNAQALSQLDPSILTGIAQLIQAWKGGQSGPTQNDIYGEMFKQMGLDIVQAGLDGIKQQIYPQFVPQPRPSPQIPGATPQPQNQKFTGFS